MDRLERNCADAVMAYLEAGSAAITAIPLRQWDSNESATMPRGYVKAEQGEEQVWGYGVYSISVEIEIIRKATKDRDDTIDNDIQRLLSDSGFLDAELTTEKFYCYGRVTGAPRSTESGDGKRRTKVVFSVYGFDLERFVVPLGDDEGNAIDFGGGVILDVSQP